MTKGVVTTGQTGHLPVPLRPAPSQSRFGLVERDHGRSGLARAYTRSRVRPRHGGRDSHDVDGLSHDARQFRGGQRFLRAPAHYAPVRGCARALRAYARAPASWGARISHRETKCPDDGISGATERDDFQNSYFGMRRD